MEVHLTVDAENPDKLLSLYRWLRDDDLPVDTPVALVRAETAPDQMGATLECVNVVLSNTIALSGLIVAVASWRSARNRPVTVRISNGGTEVELTGDSPDEVRRIQAALTPDAPTPDAQTHGGSTDDQVPGDPTDG